jgi:malate synthase
MHHGAKLNDGRPIDKERVKSVIAQQLEQIRKTVGESRYKSGKFELAAKMFEEGMLSDKLADFLTLAAYEEIE